MPNWCSNTLTFEGKIENIKAFLLNVYTTLKEQKNPEVFKLHSNNEMYFFDMSCYNIELQELNSNTINAFENTDIVLQYNTRWSPNVSDTIEMARIFKLNMEHEYEELGCGIYGKTFYDCNTNESGSANLSDEELSSCTDEDGYTNWDKLENIINNKTYETSVIDTV
jgi:hypothetical protein